jgi:hypothetical protein
VEIIFDSLLKDLCSEIMLETWKAKRATVWEVTGVEFGKADRLFGGTVLLPSLG